MYWAWICAAVGGSPQSVPHRRLSRTSLPAAIPAANARAAVCGDTQPQVSYQPSVPSAASVDGDSGVDCSVLETSVGSVVNGAAVDDAGADEADTTGEDAMVDADEVAPEDELGAAELVDGLLVAAPESAAPDVAHAASATATKAALTAPTIRVIALPVTVHLFPRRARTVPVVRAVRANVPSFGCTQCVTATTHC